MNPYSILPFGFLVAYGVIYALILALMLVSMWKIFVKMGEPGWKGIIPVYDVWALVKALRRPAAWFWIIAGGTCLFVMLYGINAAQMAVLPANGTHMSSALFAISGLLMFALMIVLLVYEIKLYHALSKAFGHDAGFTVGLIFLPVVFLPILAFGESRFIEPGA